MRKARDSPDPNAIKLAEECIAVLKDRPEFDEKLNSTDFFPTSLGTSTGAKDHMSPETYDALVRGYKLDARIRRNRQQVIDRAVRYKPRKMTDEAYVTLVLAILHDIVALVPRESLYVTCPADFVGKSDVGGESQPPRLVVNLNSLNEMQISEFISYPNIFKLAARGRELFCTFDIGQAFFTIMNDEETKKFVGFEIRGKNGDSYCLTHNRLPMGLTESPGVIAGALGAITDYVAFDLTETYNHDTYH
jgi:hypothetical protein